jgi:uncharacterized membrane protein YphA (DoxX/SURF4 family)
MAGRRARLSMPGMTLTRIFAAVLALDVLGLAITLISGNEDLVHALVIGTPINAPFTFVAVQALIVLAATRHRAGAAVLALLCLVSVVSGASDGSFAADLGAGERALQVGIVATTAVLGAYALRAAIRPRALAVG